jgi:hypothetical protein
MIRRLVTHVRSNTIAYLALFVALGGTGYAATALPAGSVGTRQLRDHAVTGSKLGNQTVTPDKLDPRLIGGSVRHWIRVSAAGDVEASSSRARVIGAPQQGGYVITWSDTFSRRCIAIATTIAPSVVGGPSSGYANARVADRHPTSVFVDTYDAQGQPSPAAFSLAVIC